MSAGPNAEQIRYWNAEGGERWSSHPDVTERVFAPLRQALLERAAPRPGERVLDVGCGCGGTSVALARAVGPGGSVTAVDISRPMLAVARTRPDAQDLAHLTFAEADAAVHDFTPGAFDLAFSQFGVMFFDDSVAAFANIRRAAGGGRLAFACWREPAANSWQTIPAAAVDGILPPAPPRKRGWGSFADPGEVRELLAAAGFSDVALAAHDAALPLGADPPAAAATIARFGAVGPRMDGASPDVRTAALAALEAAVRDAATPAGVTLGAGVWLVTARAPG